MDGFILYLYDLDVYALELGIYIPFLDDDSKLYPQWVICQLFALTVSKEFNLKKVGNLLTESRNGINETYAYKTGSNIIEALDGALTKSFTHDANGNIHHAVIQKTSASAPVTSDYLYTSDRLRLKRTSNGVVTVYHYDLAGNLIGESGANGGNLKEGKSGRQIIH